MLSSLLCNYFPTSSLIHLLSCVPPIKTYIWSNMIWHNTHSPYLTNFASVKWTLTRFITYELLLTKTWLCWDNTIYLWCWIFLDWSPDAFSALLCSALVLTSLRHHCPLDKWFVIGFAGGKMKASEYQSTEGETLGVPSSSSLCFSVTFLTLAVCPQINTSRQVTPPPELQLPLEPLQQYFLPLTLKLEEW